MRYREALFSRRCEPHRQKIRELENKKIRELENEKMRKLGNRGENATQKRLLYINH